MDIKKIDKNFSTNSDIPADVVFYDVRQEPFCGYGLYQFQQGTEFRRMPQTAADAVSPGVADLCRHTAGGRVRFRTDSSYIVVRALLADCTWEGHISFLGSCGLAIYQIKDGRQEYFKSVIPSGVSTPEERDKLERVIAFPNREMRELVLYFPLYSGVTDLWIGLQDGAALEPGSSYRWQKPVLFYGSSVTQGGCASRPGNSYPGFLSRKLDFDYINLGFSGSGRAELSMAEYLAGLDVSVFVMDYDYNAPDERYLEQTHQRLFQIYREKNPDVPVILLSKPDFNAETRSVQRREVIRKTYQAALDAGDQNVYLIDGETLFQGAWSCDCTVDGTHPNDLGFCRMAEKISPVLEQVLKQVKK